MRSKIELGSFWKTFEQILMENGEPFSIIHEKGGEQTYWACINKNKAFVDNCVHIELVQSKNILRTGIYVRLKNTILGDKMILNKENINKSLSFTPIWKSGVKNVNTLRIVVEFPIDNKTSRELIEDSLPYLMEFIAVAKKYGEQFFFDF